MKRGPTVPTDSDAGHRDAWRRLREEREKQLGANASFGFERFMFETGTFVLETILRASGLMERGRKNARKLRIRKETFEFDTLPAAFDGFTILHITDLHSSEGNEIIESFLALTQGIRADICILTGDYMAHASAKTDSTVDLIREILDRIDVSDGAFATLGNHDSWRVVKSFEDVGVRMLVNESIELRRQDQTIVLTGLDDVKIFETPLALRALETSSDHFKIAAVHSADFADHAARCGYELYLAGHTHGGQVCLPGGRPILTGLNKHKKYFSGAWKHQEMTGYTNHGVGVAGVPVRFNCPGEVAIIRLVRMRSGDTA